MDAIQIGERLVARRKALNLTQKDIADRLHVSVSAVSKWERGLNFPDMTLLEPLAQLLDMTVASLLGLDDHSTEQAVQDVTSLAVTQQREGRSLRRRVTVGIAGVLFGMLSYLIMALVREGSVLSAAADTLAGAGLPVYLALGLGIAAWLMAGVGILWHGPRWYRWCGGSWLTCAGALYTTIFILDVYVRAEQFGTLTDTTVGFHIAAGVLLAGTAVVNGATAFLHRKG